MACHHKFIDDLTLKKIDFIPTKLFIGTFNPGWDCLDNKAEWFYGRTQNNYFWDLFPRLFQHEPLRSMNCVEWKIFCSLKNVALTDLITTIDDADDRLENHRECLKTYDDTKIAKFKEFTFTDIVRILKDNHKIKEVYLTRQSDSGKFWDKAWSPISSHCTENKIKCKMLRSPSKSSRFSMTKGSGLKLPEFIYDDWIGKYYF
jgi:hypothetical protein